MLSTTDLRMMKLLFWDVFILPETQTLLHQALKKGINIEEYDIIPAYEYNLKAKDRRDIRKIIFDHFGYIVRHWELYQRMKDNG